MGFRRRTREEPESRNNQTWEAGHPSEDVRRNRRRALLIGIDKYQNVSRLNGPVNDAKDIEAFITGHMQVSRRLTFSSCWIERRPRRTLLTTVKEWLVEGTNVGDEVFLFYSGHGFQQPDTWTETKQTVWMKL